MRGFALLITCLAIIGCSSPPKISAVTRPSFSFDGDKSYELLKKQVSIGPRVPGTSSHTETLNFIETELKKYVNRVELQSFSHLYKGRQYTLTNIIGFTDPSAKRQILLCAHWDTRPTAENDFDLSKRKQPIDGANDGASGVAVLLELARVLKEKSPKVGVIFVFFDGEDLGDYPKNMLLGSKYYAKHMLEPRPDKGILVDMVGSVNLLMTREINSIQAAPDLVDKIYSVANRLGYAKVFPVDAIPDEIDDDHVPMIKAGVPTIDLIDFNYPFWHTTRDTVDKCSARSLKVVGSVLEIYLSEQ
ncbi:MAG: M28 family peptidase [bacterium]